MRTSLGIALLTIGVLQVSFRGMQRVRHDVPLWDFVSVHSAARTWLHGGDPYDLPGVVATWHESEIFADRDVSYFATVYPPTSLVTVAPLALLPVGIAMIAWLVFTVALLVFQFAALVNLTRLHWGDSRVVILIGAALASAPLQFGILSGQLSLPAISMCIIAFWCVDKGRDKLAGVLLGLACAIKPQVAAPFVAYYLVLRRLSVAGMAILVDGGIGAVALIAMRLTHINWLVGWRQSIAATIQVGGVNDHGWGGEFRDEIVDLKMLLVSFVHNPLMLNIAVVCIVAVLFACYVRWFPRDVWRTSRMQLLSLAGLSSLALLPVYHRVYDVTLLTTALAWALAELDGLRRKHALAVFLPMMVFLVPFDFVRTIGKRLPNLSAASHSAWWQSIVAPHYAWGLLALAIVIVVTMRREATAPGMPADRVCDTTASASPRAVRLPGQPH